MANYANYLIYCGQHRQMICDLKSLVLPYDIRCPLCGANPDSSFGTWRLHGIKRPTRRAAMRYRRSHFAVKSHRVVLLELLRELGFKNGLSSEKQT